MNTTDNRDAPVDGANDTRRKAVAPPTKKTDRMSSGQIHASTMILRLSESISGRLIMGTLALLILIIVWGGWHYYTGEKASVRRNAQEILTSIAELKVGQVVNWLKERRTDTEASLSTRLVRELLAEPDRPVLREELLEWMTTLMRVYDYSAVTLFDAHGSAVLSTSADPLREQAGTADHILAALRSREIVFTDLHRTQADMPIYMSFLVPISSKPQAGSTNPSQVDGVLVFMIDPNRFFYPFVQSWPTPSRTSESVLIRREGNDVVFLNELRHRANTALALRLPIDANPRLPEVMAVRGDEGMVEGVDYRGKPVLAVVRKIPGTPWFMVVKQDQEEIDAPMREEGWTVSVIGALLLMAAGLGCVLVWRQQAGKFQGQLAREWQTTFDNIRDAIWLLDVDQRILRTNRAAETIFGRPAETMLGKYCWEIVHGTQEPISECPVVRMRQSLRREQMELPIGERVFEVTVDPILDADGNLTGEVHVVSDITERKRTEENLRESNEILASFIKNSPIYAYLKEVTSTESRVLWASENFKGLIGTPGSQMTGKSMEELFPQELAGKITKDDWEVVSKGEILHLHEALNDRAYQTIKFPITAGRRNLLAGYTIDITEREQAEKEKERLQAQLAQSQKMESVGLLAGGVAHDFNNMLMAILGNIELAQDQLGPDEPLQAYLDEIQNAAQRSADLTRQLLAFARKQIVTPRVLDLNMTVEGMLKMLRRLIGENIDLAWLPGGNLGPVYIDPSQLDQILANLCVNARDAIAGVGKITIETGRVSFYEAYCGQHAGAVPGEYVLLAVSDDGCGMDAETQRHLFEPFFTTKEMGKGTGLGLATVYGAVKQNNGYINVYSEPGHGTTFKIYLPQYEDKAVPRPEQQQSPAIGGETILLVEDEPAILKMTTRILEGMGYAVIAAATPGEAIRLAREHQGHIDLLITDVVMPEMNGRDLAVAVLLIYPDMKRLFMSGYTAEVIAHHGVLEQGMHFIEKPFTRNGLATKIREVLD